MCWLCKKESFWVLSAVPCVHFGFFCSSADGTAAVIVKMGPFSVDDPKDYSVDVRIGDGGRPIQTSVTKLAIKVWSATPFRASGLEAATPHTHGTLPKVQTKSKDFFFLVVVSVRCPTDPHAVQSRRPEDGGERPRPRRHPALHLDHTWWDSFFFFLFFLPATFSSRLRLPPFI